jgi:hypothetical protein
VIVSYDAAKGTSLGLSWSVQLDRPAAVPVSLTWCDWRIPPLPKIDVKVQ